jgi:AraC family transcriptional regulator
MKCMSESFSSGSEEFVSTSIAGVALSDVRFPPLAAMAEHVHPRNCVVILLEGDIDLSVSGTRRLATTSQLRSLPAGQPHATRFGASGARVISAEIEDGAPLFRNSPVSSLLGRVSDVRHPEIATVAWQMVREIREPDAVTGLALESHLLHLLAGAVRLSNGAEARPGTPGWLLEAHDLIHDRFLEDLRVGYIAETVGIHPVHLARRFRVVYGASLGDYLRRLRLGWAASRLLGSDDPISIIAGQAGFSDQAHFTRAFSRYAGQPPNRFRKSRLGGSSSPLT